jgi:hypothetical protein
MSKAAQTMTRMQSDGTHVRVSNIRKHAGIAGQVSVTCHIDYTFDDGSTSDGDWECIGSVYGGPVVTRMRHREVFVREPERFGSFAADPREWMRRFTLDER